MLTLADVDAELEEQQLHWTREGDALVTTVKLHDFAAALAFVNAVGAAAEAANHHPDIDIRWNTVRLALTTHDSGGITLLDLALAGVVDRLRPDVRDDDEARREPRPLGSSSAARRPRPGPAPHRAPRRRRRPSRTRSRRWSSSCSICAGSAENTSSMFSIVSRPSGYFAMSLARSRSMAAPLSA